MMSADVVTSAQWSAVTTPLSPQSPDEYEPRTRDVGEPVYVTDEDGESRADAAWLAASRAASHEQDVQWRLLNRCAAQQVSCCCPSRALSKTVMCSPSANLADRRQSAH